MFKSQLSEVSKLGEFHPDYGQAYWGSVSDDLTPVKFNSKNEYIAVGDVIEYEEKSTKKSMKGTEYLQLKKVKVVEGGKVSPPPSSAPTSDLDEVIIRLSRIEEKLDEFMGIKPIPDTEDATMPKDFLDEV
jgi:hypothetical protein